MSNSDGETVHDFTIYKTKIAEDKGNGLLGIPPHEPVFDFKMKQFEEFDFGERVVFLISNNLNPDCDEDDVQILILSMKENAQKFRDFSSEMEVLMNKTQPKSNSSWNKKLPYKKTLCIRKCGECKNQNAKVPTFESFGDAVAEWVCSDNYQGKKDVRNPSDRVDETLFYELQRMIFGKKKLVLKEKNTVGTYV